jgi:putative DNA primase/helicase
MATRRAIVMALLAEDDRNETHRRLNAVCDSLNVSLEDLDGRLFIYDATGTDMAMFGRRVVIDDSGHAFYTAEPEATDVYTWLKAHCRGFKPELLIIDSTSDAYDAEENRRPHVRRYMNTMLALVRPHRGSVIHVAHVDKFTARGNANNGQTYTGSTAWNNSVRARLSLTKPTDGDDDDGRRVLTVEKINYGKPGLEVPLRYDLDRHVFVRDADLCDGGIVGSIRDRVERKALLRCLLDAAKASRSVATAERANNNASALLGPMEAFPKGLRTAAGRKRLFGHFYALESDGLIVREAYKTVSRHFAERWVVTTAGQQEAGDA